MTATISFSAFCVPDGKVAITFDFHETDPFTAVVRATDLETILSGFEEAFELLAEDRANVRTHVLVRRAKREHIRGGGTRCAPQCLSGRTLARAQPPL